MIISKGDFLLHLCHLVLIAELCITEIRYGTAIMRSYKVLNSCNVSDISVIKCRSQMVTVHTIFTCTDWILALGPLLLGPATTRFEIILLEKEVSETSYVCFFCEYISQI